MTANLSSRLPKAARPVAAAFGLVALLGVIPANAADPVEVAPEPAPVLEELPVAAWVGPYAGLTIGYGWGKADVEGEDDVDKEGVIGGGFVGYNFQAGNLVFGAEGDLGYSGMESDDDDDDVGVQDELEGSLRGRFGYAVTDNVLIYGTAGGAAKEMAVAQGADIDHQTALGYTVGAGTDVKITDQIFARGEYRFSDYGSEDFDLNGSSVEVDSQDHRIQFGIGMQF